MHIRGTSVDFRPGRSERLDRISSPSPRSGRERGLRSSSRRIDATRQQIGLASGEERRGVEDVVRTRDPHIRQPDSRIFYDSCYCGISQYKGKRSGDPPGNSTDSDLDRIIGGTVVPSQTKYPWMAWGGSTPTQMGCTGALINDRYVLTAAHCVDLTK
ncbi:unnamed protein product [Darwinula stevensoni]|uniref:Peptidase S1 domain-containing protein n=1 Tax=Darwinula stevensoni TaxID=69355 RepID=A0A7R9FU30_9CRUS|nr:unnamed protein product [Darwinula stevensoni]CAG0907716.1 unnamed protein product [Darwinula stevensoni]